MTVRAAISTAGGFTDTADREHGHRLSPPGQRDGQGHCRSRFPDLSRRYHRHPGTLVLTWPARRKLRILQVMRAPVGGLFRHVADLTRALAARGHEVGLVVDSLANDAQTESKLAELAPHAALGIHRFAMPRLLGGGDLIDAAGGAPAGRASSISISITAMAPRAASMPGWRGSAAARRMALYTPHGGVLHFSTQLARRAGFFMRSNAALMAQTGCHHLRKRLCQEDLFRPDRRADLPQPGHP